EPVEQERREVEVLTAPGDRLLVDVAADHGALEVGPVTRDAAAAAAEVEDRFFPVERGVLDDRVVRVAAAAEEPLGVGGAGDAHHQPAWGERRAVGLHGASGPKRDDALVRPERRREEAGAVEEPEKPPLHPRDASVVAWIR